LETLAVKEDLSEKLLRLQQEFHLRHGTPPNAVLVPESRVKHFVDAWTVATGAYHEPAWIRKCLEQDRGNLEAHGMVVLLSATAPDLMVCIID
jgi:hypothetical protein